MAKRNSKVVLHVSIFKEGKHFIAYAPSLDLSASGSSVKQAQKRFEEVADIFFEETSRKGTLEKVLKSLGWKKAEKEWLPPFECLEEKEFNVPALV
ncbi:MAG: hypothetical protein WC468_03205 [Candidatus Paceibacterota bacterium]